MDTNECFVVHKYAREHTCESYTSVLTSAQEEKLFKATEVARKLNVEALDEFRFSVQCARNTAYMVNLTYNTCTCMRFQLESFPCEHAVAVAMYRGFAARTLCSLYYTTESWRTSYAETIFPLPNEVEWEDPEYILPFHDLLPPAVESRGPGRPITSKIPSTEKFPQPPSPWPGQCAASGNTKKI
ncbi:uncharacterized protein LOC111394015 [Olea europaea var. sylvestris]|uniref:uncharacterized protein LOC111394015 n=1 Tax=Olea europaea var. sylvestris TaxID=158386 RepID=UPI000C1D19A8|nr:uncharacterized protein LOC111394015 [Olea europaea var. sylvestris]